MRKLLANLFMVAIILSLVLGVFSSDAKAKKEGEVIYSVAGPMYPEYGGEYVGLNMYIEALVGRIKMHPALKGKMHLKIVDKGVLFNSQEEALNALGAGAIQITYSGPRFLEQIAPEWKLANIPGFIGDWEHFGRVMQTTPWKALHEKMAKDNNVTILRWLFNVADFLIFTDRGPIRTMEDFKGQKIRFPGGEAYARVLKAFGATGISLPYTEVVTALQTNMINGVVTEMSGALEFFKLQNYTKYAVNFPLSMEVICMAVNTKWWESLDPEARKAIYDIFVRIDVTKFYTSYFERLYQTWANDPKLHLLELSEAEAQRWRKTIRSAVTGLITDIDPKYVEAIDSTTRK